MLVDEEGQVQIEAHTDSLRLPTARFSSNWELSGAQAARLASFLEKEVGFEPQRLSATGLAQHHPLAEDTGRSDPDQNSRVDLVLITSEERP
jgi:chemotaxis protein MotB